jgi:hypothetical protein
MTRKNIWATRRQAMALISGAAAGAALGGVRRETGKE